MIRTDSYIARIEAENVALRTELSTTRQAHDNLVRVLHESHERNLRLDAVVEAAKAWRREHPDGYRSDDLKTLQPRVMAHNDLAAAVDALSTPPPGEGGMTDNQDRCWCGKPTEHGDPFTDLGHALAAAFHLPQITAWASGHLLLFAAIGFGLAVAFWIYLAVILL